MGNVALFDINGKELWERHIKTMVAQGAVAGDINGDRVLEIVFGTADGHMFAIDPRTGKDVPNFPFQTRGRCDAVCCVAVSGNVLGLSLCLLVLTQLACCMFNIVDTVTAYMVYVHVRRAAMTVVGQPVSCGLLV